MTNLTKDQQVRSKYLKTKLFYTQIKLQVNETFNCIALTVNQASGTYKKVNYAWQQDTVSTLAQV